ncbi:MAG: GTPase domain-containing protein [Myxococcales bacterium]|jgi:hypothetical protein|nr:GTPase domain-containing protein [Myxococcales bacterium]
MTASLTRIEETVRDLRTLLLDTAFTLDNDAASRATEVKKRAISRIADPILPRLADIEAPLLVVVGGSTGAGKSALVNALLGEYISLSSDTRPTTRRPLLVANARTMPSFRDKRVLSGLRRVLADQPLAPAEDSGSLALHTSETIPDHMALLDAPDIDSVSDANRALATQLLDAADLWVFVTTPERYADAAVWQVLNEAVKRKIAIVVVLNRLRPAHTKEVPTDLRAHMARRRLADATLLIVDEAGPLSAGELLPAQNVAALKGFLQESVQDREQRLATARASLMGAIAQLRDEVILIANELQGRDDQLGDMRAVVATAYADAQKEVAKALEDESLLRTEIIGQWKLFADAPNVVRSFEKWFSSNIGSRLSALWRGDLGQEQSRKAKRELSGSVAAILANAAGQGAEKCWKMLRSTQAGRALFSDTALSRETEGAQVRASKLVREWQSDLMALLRQESPEKLTRARGLSYGLNALGVALMLIVFTSTGGVLMGSEVVITGVTALLSQKLLETIFGDQAIRKLAADGRRMLEDKMTAYFGAEAQRYLAHIDTAMVGTSARALRDAAAALESIEREGLV